MTAIAMHAPTETLTIAHRRTLPDLSISLSWAVRAGASSAENHVGASPDYEWQLFLNSVSEPSGGFSRSHIDFVQALWAILRQTFGSRIFLPIAQPGEHGAFQLSWDTRAQYLELEVSSDGSSEWYFRNRETAAVAGGSIRAGLSAEVLGRFDELVASKH